MTLRVKRVYARAEAGDGIRVLVDRLWPRGLKKTDAGIESWLKHLAPSSELRRWFKHDPTQWEEFKRRYYAELELQREAAAALAEQARRGTVTLLFAARNEQHNNAIALKEFLERTFDL